MIPHGFAAQPIPSTTTLASEEELTSGTEAPSGEPTEPASRSGERPILWDRARRRSADSRPRAHGACRRGAPGGCARPGRGSREAEPERGGDRPGRAGRAPGAAALVPERRLPLAAERPRRGSSGCSSGRSPQPPAALARAGGALVGRVAGRCCGSCAVIPRRRRLDVAARDADPRLSAPARQGARPRVRDDHRFRGSRALGRQGRRPASRHAREPRAGRRACRRARQRVVPSPRSWLREFHVPRPLRRGSARARPADRGEGGRGLRRRLGRGRPCRSSEHGARARCGRRLPRRTRRGRACPAREPTFAESRACRCSASPTR